MFLVLKKEYLAMLGLVVMLVSTVCVFSFMDRDELATAISITDSEGLYANVEAAADIKGKTVIVDAGHGGDDPGAVSDYNNIVEKEVNLEIAKRVSELLKGDGLNVVMTREEDVLQYPEGTSGMTAKRKADLTKRKELIDSSDAECCVSIHLNKFKQTQYHGAQVFFPHKSDESKKIAESIQKAIKEVADPSNERTALVRGKANELPIMIFRDLVKPTVVVECGFLSNEEEEKKLADPAYKEKLAQAIRKGTIDYLNSKSSSSALPKSS